MRVTRFLRGSALAALCAAALPAAAQVTAISIPAGTPEDIALQQISGESDAAKKIAAYQDFIQKFASNPAAVAYGNWQLAQLMTAAGRLPESFAYGEKALASQPHNMEILSMQAGTAFQMKDYPSVFDCAARGGAAYNGIGQGAKPTDAAALAQWQAQTASDRSTYQQDYEYLQALAYNVIAAEHNARTRMSYIQRFNAAFPDSKYSDQVSDFAILTLQSLDDVSSAVAYGRAVLGQKPDDLPTLLMMANTYIQSRTPDLQKGMVYARHAIAVAQPDAPDADPKRKLSGGLAYAALGFALLKENKFKEAIPELRHADGLLQGEPASNGPVLYGLGQAYARLAQYVEAKRYLQQSAAIAGPAQALARDLLSKIIASHH